MLRSRRDGCSGGLFDFVSDSENKKYKNSHKYLIFTYKNEIIVF